MLHIMNEVPYKLRLAIFYDAKKLELSNLNIILVIRDQSGSEIHGHTAYQNYSSLVFEIQNLNFLTIQA